MMTKQDGTIEDAYAAMASATAKLIETICKAAMSRGGKLPLPSSTTISSNKTKDLALRSAESGSCLASDRSADSKIKNRLSIYMFGARGLATIARTHGPRIATALALDREPYIVKIGTTTLPLEARLHQVGQDRYGAAIRTSKGIQVESGFTAWVAHVITTSRKPKDPAIDLLPRAIAIDLPSGMTRRHFDACLHRALKSRSLDSVSPSLMPRRLVAYDLGDIRVGTARELYAMSPHDPSDGDRLLLAIETILQEFRMKRV